jgi:hypothetical protein
VPLPAPELPGAPWAKATPGVSHALINNPKTIRFMIVFLSPRTKARGARRSSFKGHTSVVPLGESGSDGCAGGRWAAAALPGGDIVPHIVPHAVTLSPGGGFVTVGRILLREGIVADTPRKVAKKVAPPPCPTTKPMRVP